MKNNYDSNNLFDFEYEHIDIQSNTGWRQYLNEIYTKFFKVNTTFTKGSINYIIKLIFNELKNYDESSIQSYLESINIYKAIWSSSIVSYEPNFIKCFNSFKTGGLLKNGVQ